ncbi:adenosine deaminase [Nigerium massiliense]|uniref:adenosine deaminase n=1 Tax=Nigerium massiliense TaxID=1522317 RepID=UPI000590B092|nr:adenosine deaminase [Nigerium massiliense]
MRDLDLLPKAHLHLHFTGSMSVPTLRELADREHMEVPDALLDADALEIPPDKRGWYRFQSLYEMARRVVRSEDAIRFVMRRAIEDDAREGARRLELQIDPSGYAGEVGGLQAVLDIVRDECRAASAETGVSVGLIVAASRRRHPLDARTLARLAVRNAGHGPGEVIGFGLSNDERSGNTADWAPAFRLAKRGGLISVPHGGELLGPGHLRQVLDALKPDRLGHGVRAAEDPALLEELAARGIALEICPTSNVNLGIFSRQEDVPLRQLMASGVPIALSADDPLLFLSRLTDQYRVAREVHGLGDDELAGLARSSIAASVVPDADKRRWSREIDDWLASPA